MERELGIKVAREEPSLPPVDFSRPPPGFPGTGKPGFATLPPHPTTPPVRLGNVLHVQPSPKVPLTTGLPAKIPTYDSNSPKVDPGPARPPYPRSVAAEREQASKAAESVAAKLQEMQAAKEEERRKKREARMAERMAMMETNKDIKEESSDADGIKVAPTRILEALEKKEVEVKKDEDRMKKDDAEVKMEVGEIGVKVQGTPKDKKNKKKPDPDTPTIITLKPLNRNSDKKKKVKKMSPPSINESPEEEPEEFVKKSPVPLPDNSLCKSVLVKLGFAVARDQNGTANRDRKRVEFVDGVYPGQGSPDISNDNSPPSTVEKPEKGKKKRKKVTLTVISRVSANDESDGEVPPPPPGSPPRFHTSQLVQMFGRHNQQRQPTEACG